MRPYFAIVKDSFREARASRVLWILLILVTAILIGLAPFGYRRLVTGRFEPDDVRDWVTLLNEIQAADDRLAETPAGRIRSALSPAGREALEQFPRQRESVTRRDMRTFGRILGELNEMLGREPLYSEAAWSGIRLDDEAQGLLQRQAEGELEPNELRRLNRLLVEAAFPRLMKRGQSEHIMFQWGPWDMDFGVPLPFSERRVERIVNETVVNLMSLLLGAVGVFVAILATAPQINRIFDEGSINLLLSKPVSRSLLYLAKFVGGCAFILVIAAYFIAGLTLIAGFRFGVWDWRPLACLPLFVFMFMTYYCVSGLASIVWKNNIISIAAAILFWLACFSLGLVKNTVELAHINNISIAQLTQAGDDLLAVNEMGQVFRWDDAAGAWSEVFQQKSAGQNNALMNMVLRPKIIGPVIDVENDRMLAIRMTGAFRNISAGSPILFWGQRFENFASEKGPIVPGGALGLYQRGEGEFLVAAADGIYRLRGPVDRSQSPMQLFGVEIPFTGSSRPFERISPEGEFLALPPAAAAFDSRSGTIALYSQGTVSLWRPDGDGGYVAGPRREMAAEADQPAVIAIAGEHVLLALDDGRLHHLEAATLQAAHEPRQPTEETPRQALGSPDGAHFVILYHTGYVRVLDTATGSVHRASVAGQGDITAATFLNSGQLAVADQAVRVTSYDLDSGNRYARWAPPLGIMERVYFWAIKPLYRVFPKPGELDQTARYVLTGEKTTPSDEAADLAQQQVKLRPWAPVPSTALFIVVVLAASCYLMERQEF